MSECHTILTFSFIYRFGIIYDYGQINDSQLKIIVKHKKPQRWEI